CDGFASSNRQLRRAPSELHIGRTRLATLALFPEGVCSQIASCRGGPMQFSWTDLSADVVRTLHVLLTSGLHVSLGSLNPRITIEGASAPLPFYEDVKLVRLRLTSQATEETL